MINSALEYFEKYGFTVIPLRYSPPANGEKKGRKVPCLKEWKRYQTERPSPEQIKLWWSQWPDAMIGVVTGKISGVVSIDVDEEIGFTEINKLIPDSLLIPTYKTPSGGVQMLFQMPDSNLRGAVRNVPGCDLRAEGNIAILPPSHNIVGKYQWIDGLSIKEVNPPPVPNAYLIYIKNNKYKRDVTHSDSNTITEQSQQSQVVTISFEQGSRNDSFFSVALALAKGNMNRDNALYVLKNIALDVPLTDREINTILDSAFQRHFGRERNIQAEIEQWVRVTKGNFHVTSSYSELQIVTKEQKAAARMAFHRLSKEGGLLEKVGNKDGYYALRDDGEDEGEIDWVNADMTPFDVRWPLGIHELVKLYRKSIVIVAGESNAGKTAFCLNVAKLNRDKGNLRYLISEGDPSELNDRIVKFNESPDKWKGVKFKPLTGKNLKRNIDPVGFNIIDYLEIHKDFYEISGIIADIYELLTTGIAVIALQKPAGRDLAIGGRGTLDKSRLYLAIEPGLIKIVKGKIWRSEMVNPNGMFCTFKLGGGCHFKRDPDKWQK